MIRKLFLSIVVLLTVSGVHAQDLKSIFGNIINKIEDTTSKIKDGPSIIGTWQYVRPDCKFESDDLLSKAGGEVAAKKVEEEMSQHLSKLGFNEETTYTFNEDSTYTSTVGGRTVKGTFSYDKETKEITMKTKLGMKFKAKASVSALDGGNKMSLVFKADKLMSLAQSITGALAKKTSKPTFATANAVLEKYDGLMLGFEMKKNKN